MVLFGGREYDSSQLELLEFSNIIEIRESTTLVNSMALKVVHVLFSTFLSARRRFTVIFYYLFVIKYATSYIRLQCSMEYHLFISNKLCSMLIIRKSLKPYNYKQTKLVENTTYGLRARILQKSPKPLWRINE